MRSAESLGLTTASTPLADQVQLATALVRTLGDGQLNRLVTQALANNFQPKVVQVRSMQAQDTTDVCQTAELPQVSGQLDATHQRYTVSGWVPPLLAGSVVDEPGCSSAGRVHGVGARAGWRLQRFGRGHSGDHHSNA